MLSETLVLITKCLGDRIIKLKSWKGDYLHRPDSEQGVTTWGTGISNARLFESVGDRIYTFFPYHRPNKPVLWQSEKQRLFNLIF
ncbi:hypothetical protein [Nostoc sp. PCC 7107]|uniref:hypothetical protein n=1 Tax=Nostoc sp. PCC 7107 TaxID=317936 RepID=UPI0002DBB2DA|nr:hypothetical protein [Nostoc sp. PCC 7107]